MATKRCLTCGQEFGSDLIPSQFRNRKYCSNHCADATTKLERRKRVTHTCLVCGKQFEDKLSKTRKYCSMECTAKAFEDPKVLHVKPCEWCGKTFTRRRSGTVRFCGRKCYHQWSAKHQRNNPRFQPTAGLQNRGSGWQSLRERIKKRDGNKCQICGRIPKKGEKRVLGVHHIQVWRSFKTYEEANAPTNLITLCRKCHDKVEYYGYPCPRPLF